MSILKAGRNQSLDRMTKQFLAVVSEQFFCPRIDEDDFPGLIHDDHRVWRRLKQLTEGEGFGLHNKLRAASEVAAIRRPGEVRTGYIVGPNVLTTIAQA